ncbi:MAG: hypothetical protein K0R15_2523 [Clostridiales bacterium]|jgi:hypothetical protein|nr:hypothetical protein [Clostridiales bacterium]
MLIFFIYILALIIFALYFDKLISKLPISTNTALLVIAIVSFILIVIIDDTALTANKEYFMKQWYYSANETMRRGGQLESISVTIFLLGAFVFSITYGIKFKIVQMLKNKNKK